MGEGLAVRNEYRAQNWIHVIQEKKFYYWLWRLRTQALKAAQPKIMPISPALSQRMCSKFIFEAQSCGFPER